MFLKRAIFERGIPFEVKQQPSKEFSEALKEFIKANTADIDSTYENELEIDKDKDKNKTDSETEA